MTVTDRRHDRRSRLELTIFSLKGGCDLRFYFKSIRYSEDLDLDIQTMAPGTLQNNASRLLEAPAFVQSLRTQGIEMARSTEPKQTATTQRWELAQRITETGTEAPTKIEFSRRGLDDERPLEPVDAGTIRTYHLYPVIVRHYAVHTAFAQKVSALALREQVQSRDVFDLKLLLDAGGSEMPLAAPVVAQLAAAITNAMAVDYDATTILRRLAVEGLIVHLSRGRWLVNRKVDRLELPELIIAPYPAYISLQSALFHHGLIEQIPAVIYAVTPARPRRQQTPMGTISFHRMPPELFKGFELSSRSEAKIATPEKALFDLIYLAPGRSRMFSRLPELTIPRAFKWRRLKEYTERVKSAGRRAFIAERIKAIRAVPSKS